MNSTQISNTDIDRIPYSKPQPWGMTPDMVIPDVNTDDEKLWAPISPVSYTHLTLPTIYSV